MSSSFAEISESLGSMEKATFARSLPHEFRESAKIACTSLASRGVASRAAGGDLDRRHRKLEVAGLRSDCVCSHWEEKGHERRTDAARSRP
jgi:hypothetical protein